MLGLPSSAQVLGPGRGSGFKVFCNRNVPSANPVTSNLSPAAAEKKYLPVDFLGPRTCVVGKL